LSKEKKAKKNPQTPTKKHDKAAPKDKDADVKRPRLKWDEAKPVQYVNDKKMCEPAWVVVPSIEKGGADMKLTPGVFVYIMWEELKRNGGMYLIEKFIQDGCSKVSFRDARRSLTECQRRTWHACANAFRSIACRTSHRRCTLATMRTRLIF
jgi:hypothetical protein